jgi:hypothetical protein
MDSSAPRLSGSHAVSLTTIAGKSALARERIRVQTSERTILCSGFGDQTLIPVVAADFSGIVRKAISGFVAFELLVRRDLHYFAFFWHASGLICILIHMTTVPALFVCTILHSK